MEQKHLGQKFYKDVISMETKTLEVSFSFFISFFFFFFLSFPFSLLPHCITTRVIIVSLLFIPWLEESGEETINCDLFYQ